MAKGYKMRDLTTEEKLAHVERWKAAKTANPKLGLRTWAREQGMDESRAQAIAKWEKGEGLGPRGGGPRLNQKQKGGNGHETQTANLPVVAEPVEQIAVRLRESRHEVKELNLLVDGDRRKIKKLERIIIDMMLSTVPDEDDHHQHPPVVRVRR